MDALLQIGLYSREPSEKNQLPLLCWRTPTSKYHVLRISKETPKKDKKSTTFIKGQMVKAQSIYLLHKGQKSGVTIPKHNRIFMDKSLNTEYHGMLQQFLNRDCPIPWESQLFYCNKESILGTCPYGSLPLSNPPWEAVLLQKVWAAFLPFYPWKRSANSKSKMTPKLQIPICTDTRNTTYISRI